MSQAHHNEPQQIRTITDFHRLHGLPKPLHPLISLVDYSLVKHTTEKNHISWVQQFYTIGLKRDVCGKFRYGQQEYDFDEGLMSFIAPGQVFRVEMFDYGEAPPPSGWLLQVHPDLFWNTQLAKNIRKYAFFGYQVNESLFLSEKEETIILGIFQNIEREYRENIDKFSQNIIISQIETLLNYADRFYQRQFITRKINNHHLLNRLEAFLSAYLDDEDRLMEGPPSVKSVADELNVSPDYLTSMLRMLTGLTTQQHIQNKLIEKAKEQLSTTSLSISEIAYGLGFEHPQSFSKLFKAKTDQSPLAFRQSFN